MLRRGEDPGAAAPALNDVSFSVRPGEIVVLVGPNGSGKTTAMEMVSGLRLPTSGEVRVNGGPVRASASQRALVGVQLQETSLPQRLKVREAIRGVASLYADPGPVDEIVAQLGLDTHMTEAIGSLSGGWARRLDVVLACIGRPRALVLDEPTSGIDPVARAELWEFLRRRRSEGVAVLASTHDLSEAEAYADRLLVLDRGRLVLQGADGDCGSSGSPPPWTPGRGLAASSWSDPARCACSSPTRSPSCGWARRSRRLVSAASCTTRTP